MRFSINGHNQNTWIPCCYLEKDGTIKSNADLHWKFNKPNEIHNLMIAGVRKEGDQFVAKAI